VSAKDHTRGSPLATTTLVPYGDFASAACGETYRTVKKIQKAMGTRLSRHDGLRPRPHRAGGDRHRAAPGPRGRSIAWSGSPLFPMTAPI